MPNSNIGLTYNQQGFIHSLELLGKRNGWNEFIHSNCYMTNAAGLISRQKTSFKTAQILIVASTCLEALGKNTRDLSSADLQSRKEYAETLHKALIAYEKRITWSFKNHHPFRYFFAKLFSCFFNNILLNQLTQTIIQTNNISSQLSEKLSKQKRVDKIENARIEKQKELFHCLKKEEEEQIKSPEEESKEKKGEKRNSTDSFTQELETEKEAGGSQQSVAIQPKNLEKIEKDRLKQREKLLLCLKKEEEGQAKRPEEESKEKGSEERNLIDSFTRELEAKEKAGKPQQSVAVPKSSDKNSFFYWSNLPPELRAHCREMLPPQDTARGIGLAEKDEYVQTEKTRQLSKIMHIARREARARGFSEAEIKEVYDVIEPDGVPLILRKLKDWTEAKACIQMCARLMVWKNGVRQVDVLLHFFQQLEESEGLDEEKIRKFSGDEMIHIAERMRKELLTEENCLQWDKVDICPYTINDPLLYFSKDINRFVGATSLTIRSNRFEILPDLTLPKLQNLSLDLPIRNLPCMDLPELTDCYVESLTMPNFDSQSHLPKLKTLRLHQGLTEKNEGWGWTEKTLLPPTLEVLELDVPVKSIPASIGKLKKLKHLKYSYAWLDLEHIPYSISKCEALEEITCSGPVGDSALRSLGLARNLKKLHLFRNTELCLPESLGCAENLEVLTLQTSTFREFALFPPLVASLPKLRVVRQRV